MSQCMEQTPNYDDAFLVVHRSCGCKFARDHFYCQVALHLSSNFLLSVAIMCKLPELG